MDEREQAAFETVRAVIDASSPARAAFDYLIAHATAAAFVLVPRLSQVRSIELQWPHKRQNPFSAQVGSGHVNFYLRAPILSAHPELLKAATDRFGPVTPNRLGEYRKHLNNSDDVDEMLSFLRKQGAWPSNRTDRRFAVATFKPVTAVQILEAARQIAGGFNNHGFGPSTDYDLLFDGQRLPPKAVFGLAATEALGFKVRPENFAAGDGMACFRMLRAAGYDIVAKAEVASSDGQALGEEDRVWSEGRMGLVTHLKKERSTGLASAKRDQFRILHGRLFCERCRMDPIKTFGSTLGEACIEVHHAATHVAAMGDGHQTRLDELQCLCANCHRVTHRELKAGAAGASDA